VGAIQWSSNAFDLFGFQIRMYMEALDQKQVTVDLSDETRAGRSDLCNHLFLCVPLCFLALGCLHANRKAGIGA
jgi:hypothetical protein